MEKVENELKKMITQKHKIINGKKYKQVWEKWPGPAGSWHYSASWVLESE